MADPDASGDQIGRAKGLVAFQLFWSNGNEIPSRLVGTSE